ncbi:MAG: chaperone Hsp40, co-chaperone with DnaK, partial [Nitrospirota bacterium]
DQLYVIKVQIPTKLNARQKELLTEFAKESGMVMEADGDGFFDKMKTFFE